MPHCSIPALGRSILLAFHIKADNDQCHVVHAQNSAVLFYITGLERWEVTFNYRRMNVRIRGPNTKSWNLNRVFLKCVVSKHSKHHHSKSTHHRLHTWVQNHRIFVLSQVSGPLRSPLIITFDCESSMFRILCKAFSAALHYSADSDGHVFSGMLQRVWRRMGLVFSRETAIKTNTLSS